MVHVALALMAGILAGEYVAGMPLAACCAAMAVGLVLMFVGNGFSKAQWASLPGLWLAVAAMGCLLTVNVNQQVYRQSITIPDEYDALQLRLLEVPREGSRSYKATAQIEGVFADTLWMPVDCKMMLYLPKEDDASHLEKGNRLLVFSKANRPEYIDSVTGFDYARYLRRKGILWQCYAPKGYWQLCEGMSEDRNKALFANLQQKMVRQLRNSGLPERHAGIAEALLLGWRRDVDDETQQQFREAGVTHLLCVSGLHVGLLAGIVGMMMFFLGRRLWQRIVKGMVQLGAIWMYVMLTGGAPSTVRAGVMFSLMLAGDMLMGRSNSLNNLATSAVVMLMAKPMLLFDVGFQLSYSAVLGIVVFYRSLESLWSVPSGPRWWLVRKVWGWICLSTSAQAGTLPLMLLYFHQFPLYFLVANVTIVPMAGLLLATSMVVLATGWAGATWLLQGEISIVDWITHRVSQWPYAVIENIDCGPLQALVVAWVLLVAAWMLGMRKHREQGG